MGCEPNYWHKKVWTGPNVRHGAAQTFLMPTGEALSRRGWGYQNWNRSECFTRFVPEQTFLIRPIFCSHRALLLEIGVNCLHARRCLPLGVAPANGGIPGAALNMLKPISMDICSPQFVPTLQACA